MEDITNRVNDTQDTSQEVENTNTNLFEASETLNTILSEIDSVLSNSVNIGEGVLVEDSLPTLDPLSEMGISQEDLNLLDEIIATQDGEIPVNSATLQLEESTSRFSSAIWYEAITQKNIILAGLGGIGSYVAFLLARMHPLRITFYDDDIVEAANMSGQLYGNSNVGNFKADSIYSMVKNYANFYSGNVQSTKFTDASTPGPIMICGFDNMAARKTFYRRWKNYVDTPTDSDKCLFIDGRLAAEEFQVFCIQGNDIRAMELYENEWLFDDSEAEETLCSYKQTTFMANMIGSIIVNLFVNFVANECEPLFPRDVPFLTTYDASNMYFKVEM